MASAPFFLTALLRNVSAPPQNISALPHLVTALHKKGSRATKKGARLHKNTSQSPKTTASLPLRPSPLQQYGLCVPHQRLHARHPITAVAGYGQQFRHLSCHAARHGGRAQFVFR